jgi:hypothetical protein
MVRFDVSRLTKLDSKDLLRSDFKSFNTPKGWVGVSAMRLSVEDWLLKEKTNLPTVRCYAFNF